MNPDIKIFPQPVMLAEALAQGLHNASLQAKKAGRVFNLVLAGGSTPRAVYEYFARSGFNKTIPWDRIHFFWGDERCVPGDHEDSNFQMVRRALLDPLAIHKENIHRMQGENDPVKEASRYAEEIKSHCHLTAGEIPRFDWILLGLGTDGHTASLFPGVKTDEDPSGICAVATHPESGQKRITLTLKVLNHARRVSFIVTGSGKAQVLAAIFNQSPESQHYPATQVSPEPGNLEWFLDKEAASKL
ncbi:MAG: 6-phosphogluconolactonase [Nitrospinaceae bacterium]|nr:MAG: 6-phosphogluconolactonase [Nitrospinaceae bacterium]